MVVLLARAARSVGKLATFALLRVRPYAIERPPAKRTLLDDVAMRRPWNLRVKWERLRARRRVGQLRPGVTVIIVNWNSGAVTADVVRAVQWFSPVDTEIMLIDNGSSDDSRAIFKGLSGVRRIDLRGNAGHGVALDLGVCWCETTIAVTLDSDAVPLRAGWLDRAVEPVRLGQAKLAGLRSRRGFVHPVYSAIDVATFVRGRMSFQVFVEPGVAQDDVVWGQTGFDTSELLSREFPENEKVLVEWGLNPANGLPGMTVADVVYHHGGVSRGTDGAVTGEMFARWRAACDAVGVGEVVRA